MKLNELTYGKHRSHQGLSCHLVVQMGTLEWNSSVSTELTRLGVGFVYWDVLYGAFKHSKHKKTDACPNPGSGFLSRFLGRVCCFSQMIRVNGYGKEDLELALSGQGLKQALPDKCLLVLIAYTSDHIPFNISFPKLASYSTAPSQINTETWVSGWISCRQAWVVWFSHMAIVSKSTDIY